MSFELCFEGAATRVGLSDDDIIAKAARTLDTFPLAVRTMPELPEPCPALKSEP
jgi:hypothetical protein